MMPNAKRSGAMYCYKCGAAIPDDANFCAACGTTVEHVRTMLQPVRSAAPGVELEALLSADGQQPLQPEQPFVPTPPQAMAYAAPLAATDPAGPMVPPKDYLPHAIIVTVISLFCCCNFVPLVIGIISIVYASNSNSQAAAGNFKMAHSSANTARILWIVAAVLILLSIVMFMAYAGTIGAASILPRLHLPLSRTI
jgi:hypothetical protein